MLNENGIAMNDDEDLTTANEKFLGKLVKQKVLVMQQLLGSLSSTIKNCITERDILYPFLELVQQYQQLVLPKNLDVSKGLCNGTRMMIQKIYKYSIQVLILHGKFKNQTCIIPRIIFRTNQQTDVIQFSRTQFPIRLAYSFTVNKSQGQTID